jgi:biopolymer transport protein ExbB/TolQ
MDDNEDAAFRRDVQMWPEGDEKTLALKAIAAVDQKIEEEKLIVAYIANLKQKIKDQEDIIKARDETINELNYRITMGLGYVGTLGDSGPTLGVQGPSKQPKKEDE